MASYYDPRKYIEDFYNQMFASPYTPGSEPQKAWWEQGAGGQNLGSAVSQPQQQRSSSPDPFSMANQAIQGYNLGVGTPGAVGSNIAQAYTGVPGNWDMLGAFQSGIPGAIGGFMGGGIPGAVMGGFGNIANSIAGQLGGNIPGFMGMQAAPQSTNALEGFMGMSPNQAALATNALAALAGTFGGPMGYGAVNLADLVGNAIQGKNVANQVAGVMTSPLGMLGPVGSVIGSLVNPALGSALNYGWDAATKGIDPTAAYSWSAPQISNMSPGALGSLGLTNADLMDAINGMSMQQNANWSNSLGDFEVGSEARANEKEAQNAAQQQGWANWAQSTGVLDATQTAQLNAMENAIGDRGWFDFSDSTTTTTQDYTTTRDTELGDFEI